MDKKPLQSKKFVAVLYATIVISTLLIIPLFTQEFTWAMSLYMSVGMFGIVFIFVAYIFKQAMVDKLINGLGALAKGVSGSVNQARSRYSNYLQEELADEDLE